MKRLWWLAAPALCLLLIPLACTRMDSPWKNEPGSPRVVVTIPPLYSFVRGVAGDRAAVKCLCTATGPHEYQADFRDSRVMDEADLVLAVGLELDEGFTRSLHRMANRKTDLPLILLGDKLQERGMVKKMRPHKHAPAEQGEAEGPHHHHGEHDPHVWLGIHDAEVK